MAQPIQHDPAKAERILAATRDLLLKRGVRGVTIADIAERAYVGKGTVYLYWRTKEDIVVTLLAREFAAVVDEFVAELRRDSQVILPHRLFLFLVHVYLDYPFVHALQTGDVDTLGVLTEHPAATRLLTTLGPGEVLSRLMPIQRRHGLIREDENPAAQIYMINVLLAGFFQLATKPAMPLVKVDQPEVVMANAIRVLFEPATSAHDMTASAAEAAILVLTASRDEVLTTLSTPDN